MKKLRYILLGSMVVWSSNSFAALTDNVAAALAGAQAAFKSMSENLVAATSYKSVAPGEPLGLVGFDIGAEVGVTSLQGVDQWGAALGDTSLTILPVPKVHLHKGLPMNIDLGFSYMPKVGGISVMGGELRYSLMGGNVALPAVAVRGTFSTLTGVDALDVSSYGLETTVSKGFLMLTPYLGIGNIWGTVNTAGLAEENPSMFKWFGGLNLNMGLMNLAYEMDNTGGISTHSAKLGFRF